MKRRSFVKTSCTCGLLSLVPASLLKSELYSQEKNNKIVQQMNPAQVNSVFKFVDSTQTETVKESIFSKLGAECFYSRKLDKWIESFGNIDVLINWVNVEKKSRFWERLEFDEEHTTITLTGKRVDNCVCAFADISEPPKSLCNYCCKNFQQEMFGKLIGKKVNVEITESYLLGNNRCSTLIKIV